MSTSAARVHNPQAPSVLPADRPLAEHIRIAAGFRCSINQHPHKPSVTLALSSQPAARFERHKQRRPHPETLSEEQS